MADAADAFHEHLDRCSQCRDHPHELCPEGARIVVRAIACGDSPIQEPSFMTVAEVRHG